MTRVRSYDRTPTAVRVPTLDEALAAAVFAERHGRDGWVAHPHKRVRAVMLREGLVTEYRVTEHEGAQVFYRITDAGRARAAQNAPQGARRAS